MKKPSRPRREDTSEAEQTIVVPTTADHREDSGTRRNVPYDNEADDDTLLASDENPDQSDMASDDENAEAHSISDLTSSTAETPDDDA